MIGALGSKLRARRVRGVLWMVAAMPLMLAPVLFDGTRPATAGVGIVFLVLGLATLSRERGDEER